MLPGRSLRSLFAGFGSECWGSLRSTTGEGLMGALSAGLAKVRKATHGDEEESCRCHRKGGGTSIKLFEADRVCGSGRR